MSRAKFFKENPTASAWAALNEAENASAILTPGPVVLEEGKYKGKKALVIGAGVSGLTTAYELLEQKSGMEVTILEAQNRTGGRCLTLRTGDTFTEDENSELFNAEPRETQTVRFKRPVGDSEPYLNAGPGRIPSAHKRLLSYLKKFGVEVEVYVMNSDANLVQMQGGPGTEPNKPLTYRRIDHNTRGWLAQMVFENAESLVKSPDLGIDEDSQAEMADQLQRLMVSFGELIGPGSEDCPNPDYGKYVPTAGEEGFENGRSRAGYTELPGVQVGKIAKPIPFKRLLASEYWEKTRFYQPSDFLWQPTLFQPVGGMDQVQRAFAQQVAALGGVVHLNSPVNKIDWDADTQEFVVYVEQLGTKEVLEYRADYCFCNLAMPFLSEILSDNLQNPEQTDQGLDLNFKQSLQAVYQAQFNGDDTCYSKRFLACTTKVGWQAERSLWQGSAFELQETTQNTGGDATLSSKAATVETLDLPKSEVGVVPIFGGISWTDNEITQIWYPSNAYHDQKGVLTGAYNFGKIAYTAGKQDVAERLENAKKGAAEFDEDFAYGLEDGVAIAWQNMPYIKGGWAQWQEVEDGVAHFNVLDQGSGVYKADGTLSDPIFFVIGDQVSSLPGWQEGAIAASLNALSRMERPDLNIPYLKSLPDTRLMVEGV